jgi:hypothetical protein
MYRHNFKKISGNVYVICKYILSGVRQKDGTAYSTLDTLEAGHLWATVTI